MKKVFLGVLTLIFLGGLFTLSSFVRSSDLFLQFDNEKWLKSTSYGYQIFDLDSNTSLYQYNENKLLNPASSTKLLSTAGALLKLGADHKFETIFSYSGSIKDSVLSGNIIVTPGGDPTLGSKYFDGNLEGLYAKLTQELEKKAIKKILGKVLVTSTRKDKTSYDWLWSDVSNYYGAAYHDFNVYDNLIEVHFKTGAVGTPSEIIKTVPSTDFMTFKNEVVAGKSNRDKAYILGGPTQNEKTIEGEIPANRSDFVVKGSITNPALVFEDELVTYLRNNGIIIQNETIETKDVTTLFSNYSPPLSGIIKVTNQKSINLFAEALLHTVANKVSSQTPRKEAAEVFQKYIQSEIPTLNSMHLHDGSGLSPMNGISPSQFVKILKKMNNNKDYNRSLSAPGHSGTLRNFGKGSKFSSSFSGKSGSMSHVRSITGYLNCKSGKNLAISFIFNHFGVKQNIVDTHIAKRLEWVYDNY